MSVIGSHEKLPPNVSVGGGVGRVSVEGSAIGSVAVVGGVCGWSAMETSISVWMWSGEELGQLITIGIAIATFIDPCAAYSTFSL